MAEGPPAPIALSWRRRDPPLEAAAAVAVGAAARDLARRLIAGWDQFPADLRRGWRGVGGQGWIGLIGPDLPWADGVIWLGRDPEAPAVLLPTLLTTTPHPQWIELSLPPGAPAPIAAVPWPPGPPADLPPAALPPADLPPIALPRGLRLLSLAPAQPVHPDDLRRWLDRPDAPPPSRQGAA